MRRYPSNHKKDSMVSPLVDVIFNLMMTMFIFLIIYIILVQPNEDPESLDFEPFFGFYSAPGKWSGMDTSLINPEPEIINNRLPDATVYGDYQTNIPVRKGLGNFYYIMAKTDEPLVQMKRVNNIYTVISSPDNIDFEDNIQSLFLQGIGTLQLNTHTGLLSGRFSNATFNQQNPYNEITFYITVIGASTNVPIDRCEPWGEIKLYFYKKWQNEEKSNSKSIPCLISIQSQFTIRLYQKNIPYSPERRPLTLVNQTQKVEAVAGHPLQAAIAVAGGIEPYEFRFVSKPRWLRVYGQGRQKYGLTASNPVPGEYLMTMEVKDAQTPRRNWRAARRARNTISQPYQTGTITLKVNPPLSATLHLPNFSRISSEIRSSITVSGGLGQKHFEAVSLPLGIILDSASGEISGRLTTIGEHALQINVSDDYNTVMVRGNFQVIGAKPEAALVLAR